MWTAVVFALLYFEWIPLIYVLSVPMPYDVLNGYLTICISSM